MLQCLLNVGTVPCLTDTCVAYGLRHTGPLLELAENRRRPHCEPNRHTATDSLDCIKCSWRQQKHQPH